MCLGMREIRGIASNSLSDALNYEIDTGTGYAVTILPSATPPRFARLYEIIILIDILTVNLPA